jgi:UDP-glucose 4-epimerase
LPASLAVSDVLVLANGQLVPATKLSHLPTAIEDELLPLVTLAEAAADARLRRLVFISSGGTVYGADHKLPIAETAPLRPISSYGAIKVMIEQALLDVARRKSLPTAILRVSNPYGRRQVSTEGLGFIGAAVRAARTGAPLTLWGDGSSIRDFVHVNDVADAIRLACEREMDSFVVNIGSGVQTSLLRIIEIVERVSHQTISRRFEAARKVDVPCNALDITQAATILGWRPSTGLEDGIRSTLAEP